MKFLLDQNLAPRLLEDLTEAYPGSEHVRELGLGRADDAQIWDFAKEHGFTSVSKDADFHQLSFLHGPPPKVVWVRLGNCSTSRILQAMHQHAERLATFEADAEAAFLTLP